MPCQPSLLVHDGCINGFFLRKRFDLPVSYTRTRSSFWSKTNLTHTLQRALLGQHALRPRSSFGQPPCPAWASAPHCPSASLGTATYCVGPRTAKSMPLPSTDRQDCHRSKRSIWSCRRLYASDSIGYVGSCMYAAIPKQSVTDMNHIVASDLPIPVMARVRSQPRSNLTFRFNL